MADLPILRHMAAVTDPIRCRLLRVLEVQELTVTELCSVLQLPQSTVSRHLKTLSDDGWVASRRDGTSRYYGMAAAEISPQARQLWDLVSAQFEASESARQDTARLQEVLASRRSRSREFFSSTAEGWDHLRSEFFGDRFHFHALLGLLPGSWTVGDLGCGTGQLMHVLAPWVKQVVGVDGSPEMLQAARARLHGIQNVELQPGELEELPLRDAALDAALLVLVLHYVPDPVRVLTEARRVLRPGAPLLVVELLPHENDQQALGQVWLGFTPQQMERYLALAGFSSCRSHPLPLEPGMRGPGLFAAVAARAAP